MSRKKLMAGNWKMFKTVGDALALVRKLKISVGQVRDREVVVCPPFTSLKSVSEILTDTTLRLGAQNMHFEKEGAFTGEISPAMLADLGVLYVIIGHSERRHVFGETDDAISKKVPAAVQNELLPILCVGETLQERQAGQTEPVVLGQLKAGVRLIGKDQADKLTIAYEPVWAIGTGQTATPKQAQEVHAVIRKTLHELFGPVAEKIRILYGGSVKPENVDELMAELDLDGALVGGASLTAESFSRIVRYTGTA